MTVPPGPYPPRGADCLSTAMTKPDYIYDIDDRPPVRYGLLYGLQWAVIMFPGLVIVARLSGVALGLEPHEEIRFFQYTLVTSGLFTIFQSLVGHRYPVLEGPSTALLLTLIALAPHGFRVIQGGMAAGGAALVALVLFGQLRRAVAFASPNVVGVILMLVALSLLPHLMRIMAGADPAHPNGDILVFGFSLVLVLLMATLSHWCKGFWKTIVLLLGMIVGSILFFLWERPSFSSLADAAWVSLPSDPFPSVPVIYWPSVVAFISSYAAVLVNSLGSLHGVAKVTDSVRLPGSIARGIMVNGLAGVSCGLLGIVGTVSYSLSPGVILTNRVASRYATAYCGGILLVAAFIPKLASAFSAIPAQVVGAALFVAMGTQLGAGLSIISSGGMNTRDYFVVGLPLLLGTGVAFLPPGLLSSLPVGAQVLLGNGLMSGILLVLLLEHVVMPVRSSRAVG